MRTVNMLEAKTQLSRLVDAVERGEEDEVIIARDGKPAARLVPLAAGAFQFGIFDGQYDVPESLSELNASDAEIAAMFEGSDLVPDHTGAHRKPKADDEGSR